MENKNRRYKFLGFITASFVAILLISNIASTKIVSLGPLSFDGGTLLFPLAYIFGDILTEVYGYSNSRKVIWTGFLWIAIASLIFFIVDLLPPANGYTLSDSFHNIAGQVPRIVLASLIAYLSGEFSNSYILAKMKIITKGKWLWTRTIGSTLIGEFVDTGIFILVAFYNVLPSSLLISILISNYIFKVGVEILFTPITYYIVNNLKKSETEDNYDYDTDFNPSIVNR